MSLTVPDSAVIDAFRGVAVSLGCLLIVGLIILRLFGDLNRKARAAVYTVILLSLPPLATEVEQIGKPMLIWRLPVTTVAFLVGLGWAVRGR